MKKTQCKSVARSISSEPPPSLLQGLKNQLHLAQCNHCRRYAKQIRWVNEKIGSQLRKLSHSFGKEEKQAFEDQTLQIIQTKKMV